jgi:hypothetical protein
MRLTVFISARLSQFANALRVRGCPEWVQENTMSQDRLSGYLDCIAACNACNVSCQHCASLCLQEPEVKKMTRCIALDFDCAELCSVCVALMAGGSGFAGELCALCARACRMCAEECAKHDMDHCQQCAEACRVCAEACERIPA